MTDKKLTQMSHHDMLSITVLLLDTFLFVVDRKFLQGNRMSNKYSVSTIVRSKKPHHYLIFKSYMLIDVTFQAGQ